MIGGARIALPTMSMGTLPRSSVGGAGLRSSGWISTVSVPLGSVDVSWGMLSTGSVGKGEAAGESEKNRPKFSMTSDNLLLNHKNGLIAPPQ